jgi:hypothetical protein
VLCEQANCLAHLQQITHMASAEGGEGLSLGGSADCASDGGSGAAGASTSRVSSVGALSFAAVAGGSVATGVVVVDTSAFAFPVCADILVGASLSLPSGAPAFFPARIAAS